MIKKNKEQVDWSDFLKYSSIFTPSRREQFETIVSLLPVKKNESFVFVDLGCGGGDLIYQILKSFPRTEAVGVDVSRGMLDAARKRLARFGERVELIEVDLRDKKLFRVFPKNIKCFISSLAIHHLSAKEKRWLFKESYSKLSKGGAFIIADLVLPASKQARDYFGNLCDKIVKEQSMKDTGSLMVFNIFKRLKWNNYKVSDPDEYDKPSRLFDQLKWLEDVGDHIMGLLLDLAQMRDSTPIDKTGLEIFLQEREDETAE